MVNGFEFCSLESKIDMDFLYSAFNAEDQFLYSTNLHSIFPLLLQVLAGKFFYRPSPDLTVIQLASYISFTLSIIFHQPLSAIRTHVEKKHQ